MSPTAVQRQKWLASHHVSGTAVQPRSHTYMIASLCGANGRPPYKQGIREGCSTSVDRDGPSSAPNSLPCLKSAEHAWGSLACERASLTHALAFTATTAEVRPRVWSRRESSLSPRVFCPDWRITLTHILALTMAQLTPAGLAWPACCDSLQQGACASAAASSCCALRCFAPHCDARTAQAPTAERPEAAAEWLRFRTGPQCQCL